MILLVVPIGLVSMILVMLFPNLVARRKIDFGESVWLATGNLWRLFWIHALGLLPVMILYLLVASGARQIAISLFNQQSPGALSEILPLLLGLFLAVTMIVTLVSYAYKALRNISADAYLDQATGEPLSGITG